jgi:diguanylate cyclase (GGDEF)-like protein/PAS domain S-box-containing protein
MACKVGANELVLPLRDVIAHLPVPVATVRVTRAADGSTGWEILTVNDAFTALFAVAPGAARGQDLRRFYSAAFDAIPLKDLDALAPIRVDAQTCEPLGRSTEVHLNVAPAGSDPTLRIVSSSAWDANALTRALHNSREQFRRLVHDSPDMTWVLDTAGTVIDINEAGASMLGLTRDEIVGRDYRMRVRPEDQRDLDARLSRVMHRSVEQFETKLVTRDGEVILLDVLARPYVEDGRVVGLFGRARNITDQREIELQLKESEERYRSLYEDNVDAVSTIAVDGTILFANPVSARLMGLSPDEVVGRNFLPYIVPERQEETFANFAAVLEGRTTQYETSMITADGSVVDLHITIIPIIVDGVVSAVHCIGKDITEVARMRQELHDMAYRDAVTGLPNSNALDIALSTTIAAGEPFAVLEIDMDRLKAVNDTWGRHVGDRLLRSVADRIREGMSAREQLFRHVGDDFVLLRPHESVEDTVGHARSLEQALRETFLIGELPIKVSVSVGIALFPWDGFDAETLLRDADNAMLSAKRSGRLRVALHRELLTQEEARGQRMELALRDAIAQRELSLVFQPQVDLNTGELHGVEALLRWQHPEWGAISPVEFIPLAERTGLIHEIGMWVIEAACHHVARWRDAGLGDISMSVNTSVDQFYDADFAHHLEAALDFAGISPKSLVLEVTESIASQSGVVIDQLHRLASTGVRVAIDDFGTGYSSLRYLREFPVDYLKIDRSFVDQMEASERDHDLVATIVSLAQNFGLATIAEGVETESQATVLRSLGAEFAQGYLIGRPMTTADFEAWRASRG